MHRCAGVQKVSRPIVMCQEMSQCSPTMAAVAANVSVHAYHGTDSAASRTATRRAAAGNGTATLFAMISPENVWHQNTAILRQPAPCFMRLLFRLLKTAGETNDS